MNKKAVIVSLILSLTAITLIIMLAMEKEVSRNLKIENTRIQNFMNDIVEKNDLLNDEKETKLQQLQDQLSDAQSNYEVVSLEKKLLQDEIRSMTLPDYVTLRFLEEKGISDYHLLEKDLRNKGPDVIGYDGVLGGTMSFGDIRIISPRWVYSDFEDGHIAGYGIYEYSISDEGEISWTVLLEFIPE